MNLFYSIPRFIVFTFIILSFGLQAVETYGGHTVIEGKSVETVRSEVLAIVTWALKGIGNPYPEELSKQFCDCVFKHFTEIVRDKNNKEDKGKVCYENHDLFFILYENIFLKNAEGPYGIYFNYRMIDGKPLFDGEGGVCSLPENKYRFHVEDRTNKKEPKFKFLK